MILSIKEIIHLFYIGGEKSKTRGTKMAGIKNHRRKQTLRDAHQSFDSNKNEIRRYATHSRKLIMLDFYALEVWRRSYSSILAWDF